MSFVALLVDGWYQAIFTAGYALLAMTVVDGTRFHFSYILCKQQFALSNDKKILHFFGEYVSISLI